MLVTKDVLKLKETDKKKFNDAKPGDKIQVVLDVVGQKRIAAGQILVKAFVNTNKNAICNEGKNRDIYNKYLKLSGICLFSMPFLCPL